MYRIVDCIKEHAEKYTYTTKHFPFEGLDKLSEEKEPIIALSNMLKKANEYKDLMEEQDIDFPEEAVKELEEMGKALELERQLEVRFRLCEDAINKIIAAISPPKPEEEQQPEETPEETPEEKQEESTETATIVEDVEPTK